MNVLLLMVGDGDNSCLGLINDTFPLHNYNTEWHDD